MRALAKHRRYNGFTLVELLTTIAVLSILSGIATLSYGSWRRSVAQKAVAAEISSLQSALRSHRNFNPIYPASLTNLYTVGKDMQVFYSQDSGGAAYCANITSVQYPEFSSRATSSSDTIENGKCPTQP